MPKLPSILQTHPQMSTVLLTGVNGLVASTILRKLLERGHTVIGTVRAESKATFLREQFKAALDSDKLKFAVVGDIIVPAAFDNVLRVTQFDVVLRTSSPFHYSITDIDKELLQPPLFVKRVVVTSSFASVVDSSKGTRPDKIYTEGDWNPTDREEGLKDIGSGYFASKKLAEQAAWDFVEEKSPSFTLTALCPRMVFGPPEQEVPNMAKLNTSNLDIYDIFNGTSDPRYRIWIWVDVWDLAEAQGLAMHALTPTHLMASALMRSRFVDYIWKHYPERAAAKGFNKHTPGKYYIDEGVYGINASKSTMELGMKCTPIEDMLRDTLKSFEDIRAEGK
ncbi:methylglyoxal reductase (NADPH-dependent) gre2 [Tulasnella sp. 417]|nr:methylglyoxal reductase (NADPH-dependent) gre2 [Tulasnella sp. 417]